ncbi:MAG: SagB/ThcOx family dehydrogenase [Chloroflexota bacterium]|nr:SagB/ThcOx family dehydrogenase [Chloroflexota bacterium]
MTEIKLPEPKLQGEVSVEEAIAKRRSVRDYKTDALNLEQLSQLLWAAQGITAAGFFRAAPSAGASYPLEVFVIAGNTVGLDAGIYRYNVQAHSLSLHKSGDFRDKLGATAAFNQGCISDAPACISICAVYERTSKTYGKRGERYVHIDTGHAAENIALQAVALGLATVMIGAFEGRKVSEVLGLDDEMRPLYIIPVGKQK